MNYYNEHDPKAAAWLRELIAQGHLPPGFVDSRDIQLVQPADLVGYTQCHFFAGIGGWSLALHLAGVPTTTRLWTGSCPCQPFSVAGKGLGKTDPRHLWPQFRRLIRLCRPPVVFGKQVASAAGRIWLSGVCADLEALAYRTAAADLCAAGGAPRTAKSGFCVAIRPLPGNAPPSPPHTSASASGGALAGWRSPDHNQRGGSYADPEKALARLSSGHQINLEDQVVLGDWPTPMAGTPAQNGNNEAGNTDYSRKCVELTGWNTPRASDGSNGGHGNPDRSTDGMSRIEDQVQRVIMQAPGPPLTSSPAATAKRGALNPSLSGWLMGYPRVWLMCGERALKNLKKK